MFKSCESCSSEEELVLPKMKVVNVGKKNYNNILGNVISFLPKESYIVIRNLLFVSKEFRSYIFNLNPNSCQKIIFNISIKKGVMDFLKRKFFEKKTEFKFVHVLKIISEDSKEVFFSKEHFKIFPNLTSITFIEMRATLCQDCFEDLKIVKASFYNCEKYFFISALKSFHFLNSLKVINRPKVEKKSKNFKNRIVPGNFEERFSYLFNVFDPTILLKVVLENTISYEDLTGLISIKKLRLKNLTVKFFEFFRISEIEEIVFENIVFEKGKEIDVSAIGNCKKIKKFVFIDVQGCPITHEEIWEYLEKNTHIQIEPLDVQDFPFNEKQNNELLS